jgi:hypothetical protein
MAILLGAFIIQGITPGPDMLDPNKYLTLTFSFVWLIVIANIITVAFCFLFLSQLVKITNVKGSFLIPFILLLVFMGGFTEKNSFGDISLVLFFGALGWLMVQFNWPRPPLLLGIVLGDIAEANFFISMATYGMSWLTHPAVLVIAGLIAAAIAYSVYQSRKQRREGHVASDVELEIIVRNPMYDPLFTLFIVGVFAYVVRDGFFGFGVEYPRAAVFPAVIGILGLILALIVFAGDCYRVLYHQPLPTTPHVDLRTARRRALVIGCWILGFFCSIWALGFNATALVATFLYLKFGSSEKGIASVLLALVAWGFFYGLFDYTFHLPMPQGEFFNW